MVYTTTIVSGSAKRWTITHAAPTVSFPGQATPAYITTSSTSPAITSYGIQESALEPGQTISSPILSQTPIIPIDAKGDIQFTQGSSAIRSGLYKTMYEGGDIIQHPSTTISGGRVSPYSSEYRDISMKVSKVKGQEEWETLSPNERLLRTGFTTGLIAVPVVASVGLAPVIGPAVFAGSTLSSVLAFDVAARTTPPMEIISSPEFGGSIVGSIVGGYAGAKIIPKMDVSIGTLTRYEQPTGSLAVESGQQIGGRGISISAIQGGGKTTGLLSSFKGLSTDFKMKLGTVISRPKDILVAKISSMGHSKFISRFSPESMKDIGIATGRQDIFGGKGIAITGRGLGKGVKLADTSAYRLNNIIETKNIAIGQIANKNIYGVSIVSKIPQRIGKTGMLYASRTDYLGNFPKYRVTGRVNQITIVKEPPAMGGLTQKQLFQQYVGPAQPQIPSFLTEPRFAPITPVLTIPSSRSMVGNIQAPKGLMMTSTKQMTKQIKSPIEMTIPKLGQPQRQPQIIGNIVTPAQATKQRGITTQITTPGIPPGFKPPPFRPPRIVIAFPKFTPEKLGIKNMLGGKRIARGNVYNPSLVGVAFKKYGRAPKNITGLETFRPISRRRL